MLFSSPFFSLHSFICSEGIVMLLSSTHHLVLSRSCPIPSIYRRSAVQIISFLFPSLSCFNRSVVSIIPLPTGLSSKCFHFSKFIFYSIHFQSEYCRNIPYRSLYISFLLKCLHVLPVHCNTFFMLSTYKVLVMFLVPLF